MTTVNGAIVLIPLHCDDRYQVRPKEFPVGIGLPRGQTKGRPSLRVRTGLDRGLRWSHSRISFELRLLVRPLPAIRERAAHSRSAFGTTAPTPDQSVWKARHILQRSSPAHEPSLPPADLPPRSASLRGRRSRHYCSWHTGQAHAGRVLPAACPSTDGCSIVHAPLAIDRMRPSSAATKSLMELLVSNV